MIISHSSKYIFTRIISYMLIMVICSGASGCKQEPDRRIDDIDLLVDSTVYPDNWEWLKTSGKPVENEGQISGSYIIFYSTEAPVIVRSGETIFHYKNPDKAERHFIRLQDSLFNDTSVYRTTKWEAPIAFSFNSKIADDWKFACAGSNFSLGGYLGDSRTVCTYLAQYDEYVVEFSTTIEVDGVSYITIDQLQIIIEAIDLKMIVIK
jgi:hypothetical protein